MTAARGRRTGRCRRRAGPCARLAQLGPEPPHRGYAELDPPVTAQGRDRPRGQGPPLRTPGANPLIGAGDDRTAIHADRVSELPERIGGRRTAQHGRGEQRAQHLRTADVQPLAPIGVEQQPPHRIGDPRTDRLGVSGHRRLCPCHQRGRAAGQPLTGQQQPPHRGQFGVQLGGIGPAAGHRQVRLVFDHVPVRPHPGRPQRVGPPTRQVRIRAGEVPVNDHYAVSVRRSVRPMRTCQVSGPSSTGVQVNSPACSAANW